jgi:hypothetical protein
MEAIGFSETSGRLINYASLRTRRWSRDASVYIAKGGIAEARNVSVLHSTQTGAHPASYPMDTGGSFPVGEVPGREADHLHQEWWSYTSILQCVLMMWRLIN